MTTFLSSDYCPTNGDATQGLKNCLVAAAQHPNSTVVIDAPHEVGHCSWCPPPNCEMTVVFVGEGRLICDASKSYGLLIGRYTWPKLENVLVHADTILPGMEPRQFLTLEGSPSETGWSYKTSDAVDVDQGRLINRLNFEHGEESTISVLSPGKITIESPVIEMNETGKTTGLMITGQKDLVINNLTVLSKNQEGVGLSLIRCIDVQINQVTCFDAKYGIIASICRNVTIRDLYATNCGHGFSASSYSTNSRVYGGRGEGCQSFIDSHLGFEDHWAGFSTDDVGGANHRCIGGSLRDCTIKCNAESGRGSFHSLPVFPQGGPYKDRTYRWENVIFDSPSDELYIGSGKTIEFVNCDLKGMHLLIGATNLSGGNQAGVGEAYVDSLTRETCSSVTILPGVNDQ